MNDMPMRGGDAMSIAVSVLMMAAMMLPSSALMLRRDRLAAARQGETRLARRTMMVGAGYFLVWIAIGAIAVPIGDAITQAGPIAVGGILLAAGAFQFSSWKARELVCFARQCSQAGPPFRHGLRLGVHCARCCGNLMAILLALVTIAITLERAAAPTGGRIASA